VTISDHRDLVAALLGVPGVAAAAVEPLGGGPGTLRLQLVSGADEVDVAGAVNRLLRSRFGLAVDADRVRVLEGSGPASTGLAGTPVERTPVPVREPAAERPNGHRVPSEPPPAPAPTPEPAAEPEPAAPAPVTVSSSGRLVIERVQLVSAGLGVSVSVTLRCGDRAVVGEAEGAATALALNRTVAEATLRAVESLVGLDVRFFVEHVELAATGDERTALVVLSMLTDRATQRLSGASVVREDVRQAVIRAVLAAVNRRVEPMLATTGSRPEHRRPGPALARRGGQAPVRAAVRPVRAAGLRRRGARRDGARAGRCRHQLDRRHGPAA
jgi:hypothetical protein